MEALPSAVLTDSTPEQAPLEPCGEGAAATTATAGATPATARACEQITVATDGRHCNRVLRRTGVARTAPAAVPCPVYQDGTQNDAQGSGTQLLLPKDEHEPAEDEQAPQHSEEHCNQLLSVRNGYFSRNGYTD